MKNQLLKRLIASMLTAGVIITSLFPGTAYASEVGAQISESTQSISESLDENVINQNKTRGGDINDEVLVSEVHGEIEKNLKEDTNSSIASTIEDTINTNSDGAQDMQADISDNENSDVSNVRILTFLRQMLTDTELW